MRDEKNAGCGLLHRSFFIPHPFFSKDAQVATVQATRWHEKLSTWDFFYALEMAIACLISYSIVTSVLSPFVVTPDALLGGMWATAATVFVFRGTRADSLSAGIGRLVATCVSFALCLAYLVILPFHPAGLAALLGIGTLILMVLGRREDIVTTGITTTVVMIGAAMSPQNAWHQPFLRLADTVVGIAVGVACKWIASFLYYRCIGKPAR
jgi:uncharacterized membrane protein YccC